MRGFMKPIAAVPLALLTMVAMNGVASAQQSADQIIAALKPSGSLASGATRGIKMGGAATPQHAPAAAARPVSAGPAPQAASRAERPAAHRPAAVAAEPVGGPSVNLTVNFPSGSADLTAPARASLDALGKALASSELANFRFRIEGHTDNVGSREENRVLSQRRAEAVVAYLTGQFNVQPSRLEAVGMGQENPVVDSGPQTPEARNRRVQVINLGA